MFKIIEHVVFAVFDLGFHPMRCASALYEFMSEMGVFMLSGQIIKGIFLLYHAEHKRDGEGSTE